MRSLASVAEVALGRQRAPQYESGPNQVPYLRSANIVDGRLDLSDIKSMSFSPAEQRFYSLKPGDVLVTEGSGSRDTVGASAVWNAEIPGVVCFQNTLLRLRPRPGLLDGRYLAWWARHAHASGHFAAVAGGANILHLGAETLRGLRLHVPSMADQTVIANFLDESIERTEAGKAQLWRQIEILEERKRALITAAVTGEFDVTTAGPRAAAAVIG